MKYLPLLSRAVSILPPSLPSFLPAPFQLIVAGIEKWQAAEPEVSQVAYIRSYSIGMGLIIPLLFEQRKTYILTVLNKLH